MTTKEMIETLIYKGTNIKAKIEPDFFFEVADRLEKQIGKDINVTSKYDGWISVDDRLPEEPEIGEDGYIVQEKYVCEPFSAYWDGERWTDSNYEPIDEVIAWMPLPEPYKAGE